MACISNFGSWANVTGHVFAASSMYGCGKLSWDPTQAAIDIHQAWTAMTFASPASTAAGRATVISTVTSILDQAWLTFEGCGEECVLWIPRVIPCR